MDYYDGVIEPGCNEANKLVVVTCLEKIPVAKTSEDKPYLFPNAPTLFSENRVLTAPIKNSEFPEVEVITNIMGVSYNQPVTPGLFMNNQTAIGYVPESNLYFLNNKMTINAKNPYLPIHYGLGFNSNQLTDIISLTDWQNQFIWNVGFKLHLLKKVQLEAEVFKTFNKEDEPNCSIRLIYKASKPVKEELRIQ